MIRENKTCVFLQISLLSLAYSKNWVIFGKQDGGGGGGGKWSHLNDDDINVKSLFSYKVISIDHEIKYFTAFSTPTQTNHHPSPNNIQTPPHKHPQAMQI